MKHIEQKINDINNSWCLKILEVFIIGILPVFIVPVPELLNDSFVKTVS
jgi:hypothetical protein